MKLLVVSFYFEPDLSAGAFRTTALVNALLEHDPNLFVDVLTTVPNRYETFSSSAVNEELRGRVRIRRVMLPTHRSGMLDQSYAFFRFFWAAHRIASHERYSLIFATSSRLMTAFLGATLARRKAVPLYLDIRDIFVDTIADVLPARIAAFVAPLFEIIERRTINAAAHVNLVSLGFADYFDKRYPRQSFSYFSNGIDDEFLSIPPTEKPLGSGQPIKVVYAGNVGEGQGLHHILPGLAARLTERVEFTVIGDGGRRSHLENAIKTAGVSNVKILTPISREMLLNEYRKADVLFLHLNNYAAFRKVLPSKIFEYAALGKPVWAGVGGFSADFVRNEVRNSAVFTPCDIEEGIASFNRLDLRATPRPEFIAKFRRSNIMRLMAGDLLRVASNSVLSTMSSKKRSSLKSRGHD